MEVVLAPVITSYSIHYTKLYDTIEPDGKITDANKAAELIRGLKRNELIGTDFSSYFTEPEKARAAYLKAFSDGAIKDYPLTLKHSSGIV